MKHLLSLLVLLAAVPHLPAQEPAPLLLEVVRLPAGAAIRYPAQPGARYTLLRGPAPDAIAVPVLTNLGGAGPGQFLVPLDAAEAAFFRVLRTGPAAPFTLRLEPRLLPELTPLAGPDVRLVAPADVLLLALPADPLGDVAAVDFLAGDGLLASLAAPPWAWTWADVPVGAHLLRARAVDGSGQAAESAVTRLTVVSNTPPRVTLAGAATNGFLELPGVFLLVAEVADAEENVVAVEFFSGTNRLGQALRPPYTFAWRDPLPGSHVLIARAVDARGAVGESAPATVLAGALRPAFVTTSPAPGETGVAVTRETILRFSLPLAEGTRLDTTRLYATAAGRRLLARVELSSDRRTATLFYLENLPAGARVRVTLDAAEVRDFAGRPVDADGDGQPGGTLALDFDTLTITPVRGTAVRGRVFASELEGTNQVNRPLERVTITVDGAEETLRAVTDRDGNFILTNAPAGRFFVHIDGRTAVGSDWPGGAYYPFVGKAWEAAAGRDDNLAGDEPHARRTGSIYLPRVAAGTLQPVSATAETVVTFPPEVLAARPELAGVELRVPPNALYADSGARGGRVGIAPVAPDRLPGVLPGGLEFPLVITVQTDGAMNFDEPVPVCFPNLPDPGLGVPLPPGEKNYLYSFNHDTGEWEAVGSMTVSADGTMICTDPGVGLLQPGWHGSGPAPSEPNPPGNCPGAPRPALAMQIANDLTSAACRQECRLECDIVRRNCEIVDTIQNCSIPVGACGGLGTIIGPLGTILGGAGCGIICGQINLWRCLSNYEDCHEICSLKTDCQQPPRCTVPGSPTGTPQPGPRVVALQAESGHQVLQNTFTDQDILNAFSHLETALGIEYNAALYERKLIESEILLIQTEIDSADQLFGGQLKEIISLYEMSRERVFSGNWAMPGNAPDYPIEYTAITHRAGSVNVIRSKTRRGGEFQLFLPRDAQLKSVIFFDRLQHRVGVVYPFVTNQRTLPRVTLVSADGLLDSDGDGLCDLAEFALGSRPANPDSDGDGLPDGVEVRNGTDPLDGRPVATGVIASQPLPGGALDVCAFDNRALVALGGPGVGVLNVFNGLNPTLIAQVDTPGSAHQVACAGNLVAVADGAAGVALVDITTPADAALVRQVPVNALGGGETRSVATAADLVFAGQSSCFLAVIEAATGVVLQRLDLGGPVTSLAIEGVTLHAVAGGRLHGLPFGRGIVERAGAVNVAPGRLFVGNARGYLASGSGYRVYDLADPAAPAALASVGTAQLGWRQLVPTGSGYALGVVGINPSEDNGDDIYLYDLRDDANAFVTRLETPGVARAVSLFNGVGYVADGAAGLQVVNYLPYDAQRQPPTGALVLSATNTVTAGGYVVVRAEVQDDVQVRNVEFLLDGGVLVTDGNFPFEVVYRVPTNRVGGTLAFTARVFDTGGNAATLTNAPALAVVPDEEPPAVSLDAPLPHSRFFLGDTVPLTATARDNVGVAAVGFLVDGRPARVQRVSGIDYLLLEDLPSGDHVLQAVATDNSGRTAASVPVPISVWRQAISREYSVFNFGAEERPQAISREYSVFNFGEPDVPQAISREYSVENPPQ